MKITIALLFITLGLVCSTYAAPAPTKAEIQLLGSLFKGVVKLAPHVIWALNNGEAQDYDDDENDELYRLIAVYAYTENLLLWALNLVI